MSRSKPKKHKVEHFPSVTLIVGKREVGKSSTAFGLAAEIGGCVIEVNGDGRCDGPDRNQPSTRIMGNGVFSKTMLRRCVADFNGVLVVSESNAALRKIGVTPGRIIQISYIP